MKTAETLATLYIYIYIYILETFYANFVQYFNLVLHKKLKLYI